MTYLIDTHILIWYVEDDPKLSVPVRAILQDITNTILVSHASFWEMVIKKSIGKLHISLSQTALERELTRQLIHTIGFETSHYEALEMLPFHNQGPFDRMLIAQAITAGYTLIDYAGSQICALSASSNPVLE